MPFIVMVAVPALAHYAVKRQTTEPMNRRVYVLHSWMQYAVAILYDAL